MAWVAKVGGNRAEIFSRDRVSRESMRAGVSFAVCALILGTLLVGETTALAGEATKISITSSSPVTSVAISGFSDRLSPDRDIMRKFLRPRLGGDDVAPRRVEERQPLRALIWQRMVLAADIISGNFEFEIPEDGVKTEPAGDDRADLDNGKAGDGKNRTCTKYKSRSARYPHGQEATGSQSAQKFGSVKPSYKTHNRRKRFSFFSF